MDTVAATGASPTSSGETFAKKGVNVHIWAPAFTGFGGGITVFSCELALALHDLGSDLRLLGKFDAGGHWHGAPLWGARNYPRALRTAVFAAGALGTAARHRPDHLISTHVNFGPAARWVTRAFGTPLTLVAHGVDVHDGLSTARRAALRASERILAVSSWTRQRVLDIGEVDPARVSVLPNTFDEARFEVQARSQELFRRHNIDPDEKVILTIGRLDASERYKGHDRLLQALPAVQATCGAVRLLIIGEGDDRRRLESMSQALGVQRSVTFCGFVPIEHLAGYYGVADAFAMPSTGEGFGIVFLESMGCGTPVLAGNRDGSVDALDGGRLGLLVDPEDIGAVAAGLVALLKRQGPSWWFDRHALSRAVIERFGRAAFRSALRQVFSS